MNRPHRRRGIESWILLATFLGALGCGTLAFWPEPPPPHLLAAEELRAIGAAEMRASKLFQGIWDDLKQGGSPQIAADRIDREILPVWRAGRERLEDACQGPLAAYMPAHLAAFFRQREIAWTTMSAALRDDDPIKALRCRQAWRTANELAEKIRAASRRR